MSERIEAFYIQGNVSEPFETIPAGCDEITLHCGVTVGAEAEHRRNTKPGEATEGY